jgi:hypothetical protein
LQTNITGNLFVKQKETPMNFIQLTAISACVSSFSVGLANNLPLENALNLLIELASVQGQPIQITGPICDKVEKFILSQEASSNSISIQNIVDRLKQSSLTVCAVSQPQDEEEPKSEKPVPQSVWTDEPLCQVSNKNTMSCKYSHKNERGLFIFKQPTAKSFPNYLVCAQSADQSGGIFASGYAIKSRCEVSALHWQGYTNLDPNQEMRSDVQGLLKWTSQPTVSRPIAMPQLLADQCTSAFSDALYCTPTLLVLPTLSSQELDVCGLQTEKWALGISYISISANSSKWKCKRHNLAAVVKDEVLPLSESQCVPNFKAEYDNSCDLPYIPRSQEKIRVNDARN